MSGYLTLRTSTQSPHYAQRMIAMVLSLPIGKVRVIKPYVGGGFGPKTWVTAMEIAACLMSMKTGKPVKMNFTREEVFLYCRASHQFVHTLTTGKIGQGSDTTFAMITAETIGIPLDAVRVSSGDTDSGIDLGAYSSRQTLMTGHATKEAAVEVRRQILGVLARELKVDISEMDIRDGLIVSKYGKVDFSHIRARYLKEHRRWQGLPKGRESLSFQEAARIAYLARGSIIGKGRYKPSMLGGGHKGAAVGTSPAYSSSAQVVELSVDMETGKITIEKMTDAHETNDLLDVLEPQIPDLPLGHGRTNTIPFVGDDGIEDQEVLFYDSPDDWQPTQHFLNSARDFLWRLGD